MKNLTDLATTFASLAIEHARAALGVIGGVAFLFAVHVAVQHVVAGQAEQQTRLDQLSKPVAPAPAATVSPQKKWCHVANWPSNCQ